MTFYLQCDERQSCLPQWSSNSPGEMPTRRGVFPIQGVRSCSFLDILGRIPAWGSCRQVLLCCTIILAQVIPGSICARHCPSRLLHWWSQHTWLIQSEGSFSGWQIKWFNWSIRILLCKARHEIMPKAGITSCLRSVSLPPLRFSAGWPAQTVSQQAQLHRGCSYAS